MTPPTPPPASRGALAAEDAPPILQVWDGVLAVPVVGSLDSARALGMTQALLDRLVATGAESVLLDITGIAVVDSAVAKHLVETVQAARLLGAEVTVVGVSPGVASTLVHLGLDLGGVATRPTLAAGLARAFDRLGLVLSPRGR